MYQSGQSGAQPQPSERKFRAAPQLTFCLSNLLLFLAACQIANSQQATSNNPPESGDRNHRLAVEIAQLRGEVQRIGKLNVEALIATHRASMQERRVESLAGQEFYVRQQIASATADAAKAESAIKSWQSRMSGADANSPLQWQYQEALVTLRADADRAAMLLQQYRNWQAELASTLRDEQSKANGFFDRLNKIETSARETPTNRSER